MPTFQVLSDIHLELCSQYSTFEIPPSAPNLILAGDVGNLAQYPRYLSFIQKQCANFERVFLVLGNHDFYGMTHEEGVTCAEKLMHEDGCQGKLFVLNRGRYDFGSIPLASTSIPTAADATINAPANEEQHPSEVGAEAEPHVNPDEEGDQYGGDDDDDDDNNVTVLGCTLHSHIRPQNELITRMKIHDFSRIHDWTTTTHNAEHALDVSWLRKQIRAIKSADPTRRVLVVTHHAPFRQGSSKPEYVKHPWNDGFATELLDIDREEDIEVDESEDEAYATKNPSEKRSSSDKPNTDINDNGKPKRNKFNAPISTSSTTVTKPKRTRRINVYEGTGPNDELRSVHTWLFGHTHYSTTTTRGVNVRCVANQRGYVFPPPRREPESQSELAVEPKLQSGQQQQQPLSSSANPQQQDGKKSRLGRVLKHVHPLIKSVFLTRDADQKPEAGSEQSSFKIIYRDHDRSENQGRHEGDGSVAYDVTRCIRV